MSDGRLGKINPTVTGAARQLGFSEEHVRRLIAAGELEVRGRNHVTWHSVELFARRREDAHRRVDQWSRELDELGAPDE